MKLLRRPIEVVAWFDFKGNPVPLKFRYLTEEEELIRVNVDRVVEKGLDRFAGNKMLTYKCETNHNNEQRLFELRYELDTCKWYLYKM